MLQEAEVGRRVEKPLGIDRGAQEVTGAEHHDAGAGGRDVPLKSLKHDQVSVDSSESGSLVLVCVLSSSLVDEESTAGFCCIESRG